MGESAPQVLAALVRNRNLQEGDLLRLLERKNLPADVIREIASRKESARSYSIKLALALHPRSPREISLPLLKFLYLFDLVRLCQRPGVPADVKVAAEGAILKQVEALPRGEKITLARCGPGRVAVSLLVTEDRELIRAVLDNPSCSEAGLLRVLSFEDLPPLVVESLAEHEKWSRRYDLRMALIRNPLTPLARVLAFLPNVAVNDLREICLDRRMSEQVRHYVLTHCAERLSKTPKFPRKP